jgi:hypothetical protein
MKISTSIIDVLKIGSIDTNKNVLTFRIMTLYYKTEEAMHMAYARDVINE